MLKYTIRPTIIIRPKCTVYTKTMCCNWGWWGFTMNAHILTNPVWNCITGYRYTDMLFCLWPVYIRIPCNFCKARCVQGNTGDPGDGDTVSCMGCYSAVTYQEIELDIRTVTSGGILPVSRQSSVTSLISSCHETPAHSLEWILRRRSCIQPTIQPRLVTRNVGLQQGGADWFFKPAVAPGFSPGTSKLGREELPPTHTSEILLKQFRPGL